MTAVLKLGESPKVLVATLLGTLLVLTGGTWFTLVSPKHSKATSLDSQIQSAQSQLQLRKRDAQHKANVAREGVRLGRAMPTAVAMPQVVIQLSRLADETHVSIDAITPEAATPFSGFDAIPMTVTVSGKYFDVQSFLHELRTQVRVTSGQVFATGRLFDVQSVSLSQATPAPKVSAVLKMDAFVYSGVTTAAATPDGTASTSTGTTG